jgi:hypothetical protein
MSKMPPWRWLYDGCQEEANVTLEQSRVVSASVKSLCDEYGISVATICDVSEQKDKLLEVLKWHWHTRFSWWSVLHDALYLEAEQLF